MHTPSEQTTETVVLLHGWWSGRMHLAGLARRLRRSGFKVVSIGYPSVRMPLEEIGSRLLGHELAKRIPPDGGNIHFVTHSMGALVLRRHLELNGRDRLGRVVMLGPPNQGSEAADFWSRSALVRAVAGPNLVALGTGPGSFARRLPPADFPLLVVAGTRPPHPLVSPLPKPHDGRVSVESTRLVGMTSHHSVRTCHTALPWDREVFDVTVRFLRQGRRETRVE
jgi:triacylglycerol lipase